MKALIVYESMYGNTHEIADSNSFLVADADGPLEDGEPERARAWGAALASDHVSP